MFDCGLCGRSVRMGPHHYDGTWIPTYQITMCKPCFTGNWDGISPSFEKKLEKHLELKGLPIPERNAKGWYPRGK